MVDDVLEGAQSCDQQAGNVSLLLEGSLPTWVEDEAAE